MTGGFGLRLLWLLVYVVSCGAQAGRRYPCGLHQSGDKHKTYINYVTKHISNKTYYMKKNIFTRLYYYRGVIRLYNHLKYYLLIQILRLLTL